MATDTEKLIVLLEARLKGFENSIAKGARIADRGAKRIESRFDKMNANISKRMATSMTAMGAQLGRLGAAAGAYFGATAMRSYVDEWTEAKNKIAAAGAAGDYLAETQERIARLAMETRTGFSETADLYTRITRAAADFGASQGDVLKMVENVNKALVIGGASSGEQASTVLQLGQALGSGTLQGDELRALRENAPLLAKAIADAFGTNIAGLKKLGEEGKLSSEKVFQALLNAGKDLDEQFAKTVPTISQAFTNLNTALTQYFGTADQANGASAKIAAGLQYMSDNIDMVVKIAAVLGTTLAAAFVGGPVAAGIAAVATAFAMFGDMITPISGEMGTLADYAAVAFAAIKDGSLVSSEALAPLINGLSHYIAAAKNYYGELANITKGILNLGLT